MAHVNSAENKARIVGHRWKPGQSGNPSGRPKKKPITEIYEQLLSDPRNLPKLRRTILAVLVKAQPGMVPLLKEMADRVEGPMRQQLDVAGKLTLEQLVANSFKDE